MAGLRCLVVGVLYGTVGLFTWITVRCWHGYIAVGEAGVKIVGGEVGQRNELEDWHA